MEVIVKLKHNVWLSRREEMHTWSLKGTKSLKSLRTRSHPLPHKIESCLHDALQKFHSNGCCYTVGCMLVSSRTIMFLVKLNVIVVIYPMVFHTYDKVMEFCTQRNPSNHLFAFKFWPQLTANVLQGLPTRLQNSNAMPVSHVTLSYANVKVF